MLRHSSITPAWSRILLACSLCLLAFAFAMEAKVSLYEPATGPSKDIGAARALPADFPRLVDHGTLAAQPVIPEPLLEWIAAVITVPTAVSVVAEARQLARIPVSVRSRSHFIPQLFFRPPPSLS